MRLKWNNTVALSICVAVLAVLCIMSIGQPMMFRHQKEQREHEVSLRMKEIWKAEEVFRKQNDVYTGNLQQLVKTGLLADSLQYIPYSDGKRFRVIANVDLTKSGRQIPTLTITASYGDYMTGMNENGVANLVEEANKRGIFPGLRMTNQP
ncbi:MAG: hypothetical protein ACOYJG_01455 [Prevotella sp.]|jgi:hypothetical protein